MGHDHAHAQAGAGNERHAGNRVRWPGGELHRAQAAGGGGREDSLNVKGAYLEVWSDLLGSAGVMLAAIAIQVTGWRWLDPLVAVAIGFWVLPRAWRLFRETMHILLEGTPADVDLAALRKAMLETTGVVDLHDLHVWTLTSRRHVLTAHVVIDPGADRQAILDHLSSMLLEKFQLGHTTLQLEDEAGAQRHGLLHESGPAEGPPRSFPLKGAER